MGLFDSIKHAASSVADKVGDGVDAAKKTVHTIAKKVEEAPAAIAHGAHHAVEGVKELGRNFVKDPIGTIKSGAKQAVEGAKKIGHKVAEGAKVAGKWAWKNKADIGFWVGTTALMLAVPVSGGASGALAGGMMAARGAAIAAKLGKAGVAAAKIAKAGATAVNASKGALAATRTGAALAKTGKAVHAGRVALGGTKVGKAMMAAQKPVTAASTVIAGVNFADTSRKFAKGEAGVKDMALATLGFAPTGVGAVRWAAAKRATNASEKAADVIVNSADDIAVKAAGATDDVGHVAAVAPRVDAPKTAGVAAEARDQAATTADKAVRLRQRAAVTSRSGEADDAISATTLKREVDELAATARTARVKAGEAEDLAPAELTGAATLARERLDDAGNIAARASDKITVLATTQRRADVVADSAEKVKGAIGTAGLHAGIVNNGLKSLDDKTSWSLTDGSFARGIMSLLLARNATRSAVAFNPVPRPTPVTAAVTSRSQTTLAA
ncbi:MAG: hypothetical protein JWL76_113 [Thermoleophilia bacterium]|nr:hypothetical protein [Thermoleophilia bacterium]